MSRAWRYGTAALLLITIAGCGRVETGPRAAAEVVTQIRSAVGGGAGGGDIVVDNKFKQSSPDAWVSISGTFTYDGTAPARANITSTITKDQQICAPGPVFSEQLIVNPSNLGIKNVVIYLATKKGREIPIHESAQSSSGKAPVLDQKACVFTPHVLAVYTGFDTLLLRNSDSVGHNTAINAQRGSQINSTIPGGGSLPYAMTAEEVSPVGVACTIHPWMKGYLMPRSNGYFAVTDENGKFTIADLPAGDKLVMKVWHESAGSKKTIRCTTDSAANVQADRKGFSIILDEKAESAPNLIFKIPGSTFN